ncbi:MAG: hypothetical protein M1839_002924 [Geoglossum umbratile]|nr:MAG: hypothetical protein M1839_002924 [Geoglossum umbratile]
MASSNRPVIEVVTTPIQKPENVAQPPTLRRSTEGMLPTIEDVDSTKTLTPTTSNLEKTDSNDPCASSPFYCHRTTRYSFEVQKSDVKPIVSSEEIDLEYGVGRASADCHNTPRKDCSVWPGKNTLLERRKQCKKRSRCSPMRGLSKQQKLCLKILIALLVVAAAVGIGVGISRAVGGGVWKNNNEQRPIGDSGPKLNTHDTWRESKQTDKASIELASRANHPNVKELPVKLLNENQHEVQAVHDAAKGEYFRFHTGIEEAEQPDLSTFKAMLKLPYNYTYTTNDLDRLQTFIRAIKLLYNARMGRVGSIGRSSLHLKYDQLHESVVESIGKKMRLDENDVAALHVMLRKREHYVISIETMFEFLASFVLDIVQTSTN